MAELDFQPLPGVPPSVLGESPLWHPREQVLYWCDIPGRALHRFDPATTRHDHWPVASEPSCIAPLHEGGLLVAMRDGLWRFDTRCGERTVRLAAPPYDPAAQRFNDGKADPLGRLWVGTIDDARRPDAALYRHAHGRIDRMAEGITVSNGLAFSPDGATLYWSDTKAHTVFALDFDLAQGTLGPRRVFAAFAPRGPGQDLADYGGRPDGAAMDSEGGYWSALFEGQRLLRLAPDGRQLAEIRLPVRCPTMPCFGGPDLRTLYVTTARENRPAEELAAQPWAGCVLQARVDVAGLPAHMARL
jgi:sugar lactone lactonase YvrE